MTIRPIRVLGDAVLRTPCDPVTSFDAELRALVTDLLDTVTGEQGRAGVAANQIGVSARVFSYAVRDAVGYVVNPVLTDVSEETQEDDEGCLSIPGFYFPRRRAASATVHGFDQHGEPITVSGTGFLARALQHEVDHLDGKLFIDGLTGDVRRQALRAIRAAPWAAR
jgi:peptide deformylase